MEDTVGQKTLARARPRLGTLLAWSKPPRSPKLDLSGVKIGGTLLVVPRMKILLFWGKLREPPILEIHLSVT